MTNTTTTTTPRRGRLLPLVALGIAAAATGATTLGLPIPQAALAAPGDEIDAGTFDLGTLAEGEELPGGGGGVSSLDLTDYGVPAGTVLTEPGAPFELGSNGDGYLRWAWVGADVVEQLGYGPMTQTVTVHTPNGEIVVVRFTWDWSAAAPVDEPEPEEPVFEVGGLSGRSPGSDAAYCSPGDLTIPLSGAEEGVTYSGEVSLPYGTATLAEDGSALIITGYDPAGRVGTGLEPVPSIVTLVESDAFTATDGEQTDEDVLVSVALGTWCGDDLQVTSTDGGRTYEIDLTGLFDSLTTPGVYERPAEWVLSALPSIDVGELAAYDADGNRVDISGAWGEPSLPGTATRLVFTLAEGADPSAFSLTVTRQDGAKGVVPAPVTLTFEPVDEPEEPTPAPAPEPQPEPQPEPEPEPEPEPVKPPRVTE